MAMGTRKKRHRQEPLWYGSELPAAPGHPFYSRLNEVLDKAGFDQFCEEACAGFYHATLGRPSLAPGMYSRMMTVGFFEGLDSERGIAWRLADSLTLRQFLSIGLDENTPDHVTISRTRRLIDGETHQRIFTWVLEQLAQDGLIKGKTIGVDSTTLEANAAMKSIVRRDTGESYNGYLQRLAEAEGVRGQRRGGVAPHGPQTQKEDFQRRLGEPKRRRSGDHEVERRTHSAGLQSGECGGHGDRGDPRGNHAWRRRLRHGNGGSDCD
jgi:transposase